MGDMEGRLGHMDGLYQQPEEAPLDRSGEPLEESDLRDLVSP